MAAAVGEARGRIEAIDALRGFAVFAILPVNIISFGMPQAVLDDPALAGPGALDQALWWTTMVGVEGAMRGLFSLLFGASFLLFMAKEQRADEAQQAADLYYRRTLWLIAFGVIHAYALLWPGDILLIYGLAGLLLFPFRNLQPRALVACALAILAFLVALDALSAASEGDIPSPEDMAKEMSYHLGPIAAVYAANAERVAAWSETGDLIKWTADALMMMFLGMALYKNSVLAGARSKRSYAVLAVAGLCSGLGVRLLMHASLDKDEAGGTGVLSLLEQPVRVALTLGYLGLFALAFKYAASSPPMRALAAVGRMALTNYVGQTVLAGLVFTSLGLGLFGALSLSGVFGVMLAIWAAELAFSSFWLRYCQMGPLEWVWRCLTYWRRRPLRKTAPQVATAGAAV